MSYASSSSAALLAALALVVCPERVIAQQSCSSGTGDRVVLLHGLNADSTTWTGFRGHLTAELPTLKVCNPTLGQARHLAEQAATVVSHFGTGPAPVLVGHSQGGLIAREAARTMPTLGVVTLGTPHGGAPIALHEDGIRFMAQLTIAETFVIAEALIAKQELMEWEERMEWNRSIDTRYILAGFASIGSAALSVFTQGFLGHFLAGQPALTDLPPSSAFLSSLNSSSNIAQEVSAIPVRIGIVSNAGDYDPWVGPFALLTPDAGTAYQQMNAVVSAGWMTFDFGALLMLEASPYTQWWSTDVLAAAAAIDLGQRLVNLPDTYCGWTGGCTGMGDFLVPFTSQVYPGAANRYLWYGPVHNRQTTDTDVWNELETGIRLILGL